MGLLIYLVMGWGLLWFVHAFLCTRRMKLRRRLKQFRAHVLDRLHWDADILPAEMQGKLKDLAARAVELRTADAGRAEMEKFLSQAFAQLGRVYPKKRSDFPREILELLIVVFGVVMGIRALFLQPFKIPTGSMQPTLCGIHFLADEQAGAPRNWGRRFFDYLNFSARHVNVRIREDGEVSAWSKIREKAVISLGPVRFFEYCEAPIGDQWYRLPGARDNVINHILKAKRGNVVRYKQGDVLAGELLMGDHLFVDRVSYNFVEPKRGDIVVFVTTGICRPDGGGLPGLHYIKRLAGLPGDTLRITNRRLYVKAKGAAEFKLIGGKMYPAFDRIYSMKGGYRGYCHSSPLRLSHNADEVTVPAGHYFMLGDNSESSSDSRYWRRGFVPRRNIVGRALFVWWPFSRRWGLTDRAEPLDVPTPPRVPVRLGPGLEKEFE